MHHVLCCIDTRRHEAEGFRPPGLPVRCAGACNAKVEACFSSSHQRASPAHLELAAANAINIKAPSSCLPGRAARDAGVATRDGIPRVGAADAGMGTRVGGPMLPSRRGVLSGDLKGSCLRTTGVDCPTPDDGRACTALKLRHGKSYPFVATCCDDDCFICLYISVRTFFFCQDAVLSESWCWQMKTTALPSGSARTCSASSHQPQR